MKWLSVLAFYGTISLLFVRNVSGYNFLVVFPMFSPSHFILGHGLAKGLVGAGHKVTMISPFKAKSPMANYTEIVLDGIGESLQKCMFVSSRDF